MVTNVSWKGVLSRTQVMFRKERTANDKIMITLEAFYNALPYHESETPKIIL